MFVMKASANTDSASVITIDTLTQTKHLISQSHICTDSSLSTNIPYLHKLHYTDSLYIYRLFIIFTAQLDTNSDINAVDVLA